MTGVPSRENGVDQSQIPPLDCDHTTREEESSTCILYIRPMARDGTSSTVSDRTGLLLFIFLWVVKEARGVLYWNGFDSSERLH